MADEKKSATPPAPAKYRVTHGSISFGLTPAGEANRVVEGEIFTPSPEDAARFLALGVIEAL